MMRSQKYDLTHFTFFLLILFCGVITSGGFLLHGKLYWDTGRIFLQFRDQLHSLNVFGEPAYWFPQHQMGSPGFYHSILGIPSCIQPAFALVGFVVWALGKFGVIFSQYQKIYVFYFGFLIPTIFLHSLWVFSRRLYPSSKVQLYILILGAFSPGILFNLSDVGYLEPTAYGLYFLAALWDFYFKRETRWLYLSAVALGLSVNHAFLYWNLFAIPLFILLLVGWGTSGRRVKEIPLRVVTLVSLCFFLGFLPNLLAEREGADLVRSSIGNAKEYPIERLSAGNALEFVTVSLPGFGFDWKEDRTAWSLIPLSINYHTAYYYLGLLCFPFFLWGLLHGRRAIKFSLIAFSILFFGILSLSAFSPFFALLLSFNSPLLSCSHFSDAAFKAGSYLILLFGAAEGFLVFWEREKRKGFLWVVALNLAFILATHYHFHSEGVLGNIYVGLAVFLSVFFLCLLSQRRRASLGLFLVLTLLDVSTHSFLWVRNVWRSKLVMNSGWPAYHRIDETPAEEGLGLKVSGHYHFYANTLLLYRSYFEMLTRNLNPYHIPPLAIFPHSHKAIDMKSDFTMLEKGEWQQISLPLSDGALSDSGKGYVPVIQENFRTYNRWRFNVSVDSAGWLFVRDAYSPHWKAFIDGKAVPIQRAFYHFRAVPVTGGLHRIEFVYSPLAVRFGIWVAYLTLVVVALRSFELSAIRFSSRFFWYNTPKSCEPS